MPAGAEIVMESTSCKIPGVSESSRAVEEPKDLQSADQAFQSQELSAAVSKDRGVEHGKASCAPMPAQVSSTGTAPPSQKTAVGPSELPVEQSLLEDPTPLTPLSLAEEEEDEEEEEELPSFLERKPKSITDGMCVWCKFRKYPYWPAVVKSVNHKNKKASIIFIDTLLFDDKRIPKGLSVSLKTLKSFDCEEGEELAEQAKQLYCDAITWCLELIYDYRIRIGGGSFAGSFLEYCASDISHSVRMQTSADTCSLTFPTQQMDEDLGEDSEEEDPTEPVEEPQVVKLLPDRSRAARTRANKKLVDFIIRKRGAEKRLLSVLSGQEPSTWLRAHLKASRLVVDPYLEDEEHVDQVYHYLDELLASSPSTMPCLARLDTIPLVLDVLLPEALICAIAGVDELPLEEAEEKYRRGPGISKRERQEFNLRIQRLMKSVNPSSTRVL